MSSSSIPSPPSAAAPPPVVQAQEANLPTATITAEYNHAGSNSTLPIATATHFLSDPALPVVVPSPYPQVKAASFSHSPYQRAPSRSAMELLSASFSRTCHLNRSQIIALRDEGFPSGLAQELGNSRTTYPLRFWVVDNSGSMLENDGHQLRGGGKGMIEVQCSRWRELRDTVCYHANLANHVECTTVFRLLNEPSVRATGGLSEFTVAAGIEDLAADNNNSQKKNDCATPERVKSILEKIEPGGVTPLTGHLLEFRRRIEEVAEALRNEGQQAVIVLATDGLPSDHRGESPTEVLDDFLQALKSLQSLPVWVVVRLCTDDKQVVDYYNELDRILELPLEVIDDYFAEGREIFQVNPWLNYALPLHRCREMGYHHRLFDLLDERQLNKDELHKFLELLFGKSALQSAPDIHADWKGYMNALRRFVQGEGKLWNPNLKRLDYWVDLKKLDNMYGNGGKGGLRLFGGGGGRKK